MVELIVMCPEQQADEGVLLSMQLEVAVESNTLLGMVMDDNEVQPANKSFPRRVIVVGKITYDNEVHLENA